MASDEHKNRVILGQRTPDTDADSRAALRTAVRQRNEMVITISPRVYGKTQSFMLPGNSPKFMLKTKAEAIVLLREFARWAKEQKERIEGGR